MTNPGSFLGDFVAESVVPLAVVPQDSPEGAQLRALHVMLRESLSPDTQNYWLLGLGRIITGRFMLLTAEISLASGFVENVLVTYPFSHPVLYSRNDMIALRVTPTPKAPPLVGLSVVPEYGILSSNKSSR